MMQFRFSKFFFIIFIFSTVSIMPACSHLVFQPSKDNFFDPQKFGLHYKDVYFASTDGTELHGWLFPSIGPSSERGTFIQFHGNAENISTHFLSLAWVTKRGYNLFIFDYQGYGKSKGKPSHSNANEDALAALEYIVRFQGGKKELNPEVKLIVYGQSLGGAILLRALDEFQSKSLIDAVIIDSSFSSYQNIAREKLSLSCITWPFQPLAYLLMSDRYASKKAIKNISPIPLLVIHGTNDSIVPIHHGEKIFQLAGEPKFFWKIEGGKHINSMIVDKGIYRDKLLEFLQSL